MRKKKNLVIREVLVSDYAAEGRSLAKVDGKVIFIEKAVPGDIVDVRLSKSKKDWAEGSAIAYHQLSDQRVDPFCSHFGICGGCKWQMLPYSKQLEYKQREVEQNLRRIGGITLPASLPIVGAAETKHYRNKIEYTFSNKRYLSAREVKDETITPYQNVAGFHAPGIFDKVVSIEQCFLQAEPTNQLRIAIRDFAIQNNYTFYDTRLHTGLMRTMQVRLCTTGEVMLNIVFGEDDEERIMPLLEYVRKEFPQLSTILYTINTKWNDSLYDLEPIVYNGKGYVTEMLEQFRFKIGPKSFFQTNTKQAEQLYRVTRDFAALTGSEILYDLYCGTGSIGIFCSKQAKKIIGVETIAEAVEDARENAALNNISHAEFYAGDVIKVCDDDFFSKHGRPDLVITDPPRAGMHQQLVEKLLEMEAPSIVYVSCNSATQARDLKLLDAKYSVEKLQAVDMFPHTHHIENVAQLKLRKN